MTKRQLLLKNVKAQIFTKKVSATEKRPLISKQYLGPKTW